MRKSIQELIAQCDATIEDNTIGAISPADVRNLIKDILTAIAPAYGVLQKTSPQTVNLGLTPATIQYTTAHTSNPSELTASAATGSIDRTDRGTSSINFTMDIECAANRFITATLFKNGTATLWRITMNGAGTGNPVGMALAAVDYADPSAEYEVRLSAEQNGVSTIISNGALILAVDPVNSYV